MLLTLMNTPGIETFTTPAYISLDCGHLEMYVHDVSIAVFGQGSR